MKSNIFSLDVVVSPAEIAADILQDNIAAIAIAAILVISAVIGIVVFINIKKNKEKNK